MPLNLGYLGPAGTHSEAAVLAWRDHPQGGQGIDLSLQPYPSIPQVLKQVAQGTLDLGLVPVENAIEGSVSATLDSVWQLEGLQIQQALLWPIEQVLVTGATDLATIENVYSHPQALGQCQQWLEHWLPQAHLLATRSTTEALAHAQMEATSAAIVSPRAAEATALPVRAAGIQDHPDNVTRFWLVGREEAPGGHHTSLAFSLPANVPGALGKPLGVFASRHLNLSRIESRPTKRSLGEYLFFVDVEGHGHDPALAAALIELQAHTEVVKHLGSYDLLDLQAARSPAGRDG
ncbi:MAG: prephenate dehydratase [Gloeomargaritaceae cyanobacterium C42_A2020_066]|nr:prephenate dehydratase [Gloeomargaritaceae cyanobacterium C42_A2020_066]